MFLTPLFKSFNSLQTGKRIQSIFLDCNPGLPSVSIPFKRESVSKASRYIFMHEVAHLVVSIPFKRESLSKVDKGLSWKKCRATLFQFPSNGNAYPKIANRYRQVVSYWVSIPFKRECLSKDGNDYTHLLKRLLRFQFPSNGNAYPKLHSQR